MGADRATTLAQLVRWTAIVASDPSLRRYATANEYARPPADDDHRAQLLHAACDPATAATLRDLLITEESH